MKICKLIQTTACYLLLAACSSGDDEAKVDASPEGIYSGFVTSEELNRTSEIVGAVADTGEGHFINLDTGEQIVVQFDVDGDRVGGPMRVYQPGSPDALGTVRTTGEVSGNVQGREAIAGSYISADGDRGSFSLTYERAIYERSSRVQQLSGVWGAESGDPGFTGYERYGISVTVQEDGSLFGSDSKGCVYAGKLTLPDARFNLFRLGDVEVTCETTAYHAAGWVVRHPASTGVPGDIDHLESIEFGFANDTRAYYNRLTKASGPAPASPL